jgi:hypothetical protein
MNKTSAGIATAVLAATLCAPNSGAQLLAVEQKLSTEEKEYMAIALKRGGQKAARCAEAMGVVFSGEGEVKVVFDGKKGRITDAILGAPFADSPVAGCIRRAFIGEIVLPFDGEAIQVPYRVVLPAGGSKQ